MRTRIDRRIQYGYGCSVERQHDWPRPSRTLLNAEATEVDLRVGGHGLGVVCIGFD